MTRIVSLNSAIQSIQPNSLIVCGGFQLNRAPISLVEALCRTSDKFDLVSLPNPAPLALLLEHGRINSMHVSFNGLAIRDEFVIPSNFREAIENNRVQWNESDVYEIIQGLRAASMGLPFIPAPDLNNSEYAKINSYKTVTDPFTGKENIVVPAISPDTALLHVQQADHQGNIWIADPLYDELMILASRQVIVSCEKLVETIDHPTISSLHINTVVEIANGAAPTCCQGYYEQDEAAIKSLLSS